MNEVGSSADSPDKLPMIGGAKAAAKQDAPSKSPSRLFSLHFDKITKQAGNADLNNATMSKGERSPKTQFDPTSTPLA